jgi:hypothetical protein
MFVFGLVGSKFNGDKSTSMKSRGEVNKKHFKAASQKPNSELIYW